MGNSLNIFVSACQGFDIKDNSVIGFYNEIKVKEDHMDLCVFTGINYVGNGEDANFKLDYYLKCIEDYDNTGQEKKKIPLFAISSNRNEEEDQGSDYVTYESMFTQGRSMSIPCSGLYEIQVYRMLDDMKMDDNPNDRYKEYHEKSIFPISAFKFKIIKE